MHKPSQRDEILKHFFSSYFYQQSELDQEHDLSPIVEVGQHGDARYEQDLKNCLKSLAAELQTDDELHTAFSHYGAENTPALNGSARAWLLRAIQELG